MCVSVCECVSVCLCVCVDKATRASEVYGTVFILLTLIQVRLSDNSDYGVDIYASPFPRNSQWLASKSFECVVSISQSYYVISTSRLSDCV